MKIRGGGGGRKGSRAAFGSTRSTKGKRGERRAEGDGDEKNSLGWPTNINPGTWGSNIYLEETTPSKGRDGNGYSY